jgi:hypothetical protein
MHFDLLNGVRVIYLLSLFGNPANSLSTLGIYLSSKFDHMSVKHVESWKTVRRKLVREHIVRKHPTYQATM